MFCPVFTLGSIVQFYASQCVSFTTHGCARCKGLGCRCSYLVGITLLVSRWRYHTFPCCRYVKLADDDVIVGAVIIGTAEYCSEVVGALGRNVAKLLDPPLGDQVGSTVAWSKGHGREHAAKQSVPPMHQRAWYGTVSGVSSRQLWEPKMLYFQILSLPVTTLTTRGLR